MPKRVYELKEAEIERMIIGKDAGQISKLIANIIAKAYGEGYDQCDTDVSTNGHWKRNK